MSEIFKFDAKKLDGLLAKYGVKNTWLHLLATHINNKTEFQYILKNEATYIWVIGIFTLYLYYKFYYMPNVTLTLFLARSFHQ